MALRHKAKDQGFLGKVMKTLPALQAQEVVEVLKYRKQDPTDQNISDIFEEMFLRPPGRGEVIQIVSRVK